MKNLSSTVFAPVVLAIAGCGSAPIVPPPTPLERFSQLEVNQRLLDETRTFRVEIGQVLGFLEALKLRASELAVTNPDQAELILGQVRNLEEMAGTLPDAMVQHLRDHTSAAHRALAESYVQLSEVEIFDFSERENALIEQLREESRQRGARVAVLRKEISELRGSPNANGYQTDIGVRELEIEELLRVQQSLDGSFIDRVLRGEDEEQLPTDYWNRVIYIQYVVNSAFEAGSEVAPGQR